MKYKVRAGDFYLDGKLIELKEKGDWFTGEVDGKPFEIRGCMLYMDGKFVLGLTLDDARSIAVSFKIKHMIERGEI